ncbi:MAG: CinA family protein [Deltaproteobacteria bacterium]|nr:CinA family protein [Deltaproteobacteria bacterium]
MSNLTSLKRIALAESCTGGALAARITSKPGASEYFLGSVVAYHDQVKQDILGVSKESLEQDGAVSKRVVKEMLEGALMALKADIGIAVTGIAGPDGGSPEKPVGTVWLAWGEKSQEPQTKRLQLKGSRAEIISQVVDEAMKMLSMI